MNWRIIFKNTAIVALLSLFIYACDAPPCDDPDGVQVNMGFYYSDGNSLKDTLIDTLNVFLYKKNFSSEDDHIIMYSSNIQGATSTLALPLSMIVDSSTFIFDFGTESFDTLTLKYSQYIHLESHECGFVNFYNIESYKITNNQIDSIWIRKDLVEYGDEENIKIYY